MGKYNQKSTSAVKAAATTNLAGGSAYQQDVKQEIAHILLTTSLGGDKFYQSESDTTKRLKTLVDSLTDADKVFAGKAAIFARDRFGMRSASHLLASYLGKTVKGEQWTKNFFQKICVRGDDPQEILAAYWGGSEGKAVPNSMKKGFARFLEGLDSYQLAKYLRRNSGINMFDLVNLVRPRQTDAITALMQGTLQPAETWETALTQIGQADSTDQEKEDAKSEAWDSLIQSRKIGYFALLRNLRNIALTSPNSINAAIKLLIDPKLISKSRLLPFRFWTAHKTISATSAIDSGIRRLLLKAIEDACDIAVSNIPEFKDKKVLVACDDSYSMSSQFSGADSVPLYEIGILMGAAMAKRNNADLMLFGSSARKYDVDLNLSVIANTKNLISKVQGGGTDWRLPFTSQEVYDLYLVFSDCQGWMEDGYDYYTPTKVTPQNAWTAVRTKNKNAQAFCIDLAGHGTTNIKGNGVLEVAGFSDKIFTLIDQLQTDPKALVNEINKIEL